MSAINLTADPYRPPNYSAVRPVESEPEICLQPDEFQVCGGLLYVAGDVQLPQICLHTGDREDLVQEEIVLRYYPPGTRLVSGLAGLVYSLVFHGIMWCTLMLAFFAGPASGLEFLPAAMVFVLFVRLSKSFEEWITVPIRLQASVAGQWRDRQMTCRSRCRWGVVLGLMILQLVSWVFWRSLIPVSLLVVVAGFPRFQRTYRCQRLANGRRSDISEPLKGSATHECFHIYCVRGFPVKFLGTQTCWM